MTRTHTIDIAATKAALGELAHAEPTTTRVGNLDLFVGDHIRALHERGFEPEAIAVAAHGANPDVPLIVLRKEVRTICLGDAIIGERATLRSSPIDNDVRPAGPRRPGRPRTKALSQNAPPAESEPAGRPTITNETRARNPPPVSGERPSGIIGTNMLDEHSGSDMSSEPSEPSIFPRGSW